MKYGDKFKEDLKGNETKKPEKGNMDSLKNNPDKKQYAASKDVKSKKKVMARKMDKYGQNMEKSSGHTYHPSSFGGGKCTVCGMGEKEYKKHK